MVFFGYSQNIRRQNAMRRDELVADVVENIGFQVDFQSIYFYIVYIDFIIKYKCVIIECNVLLIEKVYHAKCFYKHKWIETQLQSNVSTTSATS